MSSSAVMDYEYTAGEGYKIRPGGVPVVEFERDPLPPWPDWNAKRSKVGPRPDAGLVIERVTGLAPIKDRPYDQEVDQ